MLKKLLLLTVTILTVTSCRNDDANDSSTGNQIKGKWNYNKTVIISGNNQSILSSTIANSCEKKSYFEFTDDKVTEYYYQLNNNQCILDYSGTSLYHIDSNNILYYEDNASMKIESLNNSELVFQVDLYDYDGDGKKDKFLEYYQK